MYKRRVDEFLIWQRNLDRYGIPGLRTTRYQINRDDERRAERVLSGLGSSATLPTTPNDRDRKIGDSNPVELFSEYIAEKGVNGRSAAELGTFQRPQG